MVNPIKQQINAEMVARLHLSAYTLDSTEQKRNQRQNALARVTATAQLLRQYAIYNGAYPPRSKAVNFGFIKAEIDEKDYVFGVTVTDGVPTVINKTKTYPIMLLDAYLDSYVQERKQLAVGIILYTARFCQSSGTMTKDLLLASGNKLSFRQNIDGRIKQRTSIL